MSQPTTSDVEYIDKRKYRVNVRLCAGLFVGLGLAAALTHFLHLHMLERNATSLRAKAYYEYENGRVDEAIRQLLRYLTFRPRDIEALGRLGQWSDEMAKSPQARQQAFLILDQALRENPQRDELRRRAIQLAVKLRRFQDAQSHLQRFCDSSENYCGGDAELASLKAQSYMGLGQYDLAAEWYLHAIDLDETGTANYVDLVTLIERRWNEMDLRPIQRRFSPQPDAVAIDSGEKPEASEIIDAILAAMLQGSEGPIRARAFLARAAYRQSHGRLDEAADDVAEALVVSEETGTALMQGAEIELARAGAAQLRGAPLQAQTHRQAAAEYARRGREAAPDDLRFHLILSRLEFESNNLDPAEKHLREGLAALEGPLAQARSSNDRAALRERSDLGVQLNWSLANILLTRAFADPRAPNDKLLDEVGRLTKQLKALSARPALIEFLNARNLYGRHAWNEAAEKFEMLRVELSDLPEVAHITDLSLAECYNRVWNPDFRLRVFRRAVQEDPFWAPGRLGLAETLVSLDKLDEAIGIYAGYTEIPGVPAALTRLLIRKEMRLAHRNWDSVERILEIAEAKSPAGSTDAALLRAEVLFQQQKYAEGATHLSSIREKHPDDIAVWVAEASFELLRADEPGAARLERTAALLDEASRRFGDAIELRLARVRLARQAGEAAGKKILAELEQQTDSFSPGNRQRLFEELAQCYAQFEMFKKSVVCWQRAAAETPDALDPYIGMASAAARAGNKDALETSLQRIRQIEGPDGPNGNYAEAHAILVQASKASDPPRGALNHAQRLLTQAAKQRPTWLVVPRALGMLEMLRQPPNEDAAFGHYQHALMLGDYSRDTVFRVIFYLYEHRRIDEAHDEIRRVADGSPELLTGDLARLASDVAWRREQFDDAVKYVKGSNDYRDIILQAQFKIARGEPNAEIDELFASACLQAPEVPQVWFMRVAFLMRTNRRDEAVRLLNEAAEKVPAEPAHLRPVTLGMCYEALSDGQQAEENYLAALNADPRNIGLLRVLISFYLRNNQLDKADARVDQLLDPAAGNPPDVVEDARRTRAIITASRGGYEALSRALQMLKATGEKLVEVSAADLRATAAILGRSPLRRDQIRLAGVLEEIARREELTVLGQLQLARLYEAIGRRLDAVALYRKLKDSDPDNGAIVFEFITGALNQKHPDADTLDEVSDAVTRLQHNEPDSFRTATARARLLAAKDLMGQAAEVLKAYLERLPGLTSEELVRDLSQQQKPGESTVILMALTEKKEGNKAREILEESRKLRKAGNEAEALAALQRYLTEADYVGALQGELIRIAASYFESISEWDAADAAYRNYVSHSPLAEAVLVRASYLARRNRIDEALDLCEVAAAQNCPPYSVAQVSVGVVRVGKPSREQISRVEDRLMSAINKAEPTLAAALSISLADLRDSQGRYDDAKAIYRGLLEQNSRNIVALNNLAWLVSFEPIERETALGLINQAIQLVGPVPDLLDTRAVIRLNLDRPREAIADLEDALKEVAKAAIWYHLAVAQLKIGDKVAAADSFRKAEEAGFDPKSLHSLERSSYQQLLKQMPADARRAQR